MTTTDRKDKRVIKKLGFRNGQNPVTIIPKFVSREERL